MFVGSASTCLIVLRGNSASGKSSVAAGVRQQYGRGIALVGQDHLRRIVLRERDVPGGANIGLIDTVARYSLDAGYHVLVEGILYAAHYNAMLQALVRDHLGLTRLYYLDVPYEETVRRHGTKPEVAQYGEAELRTWYRPLDLLPGAEETMIPASSTLDQTVARIMRETGLAG